MKPKPIYKGGPHLFLSFAVYPTYVEIRDSHGCLGLLIHRKRLAIRNIAHTEVTPTGTLIFSTDDGKEYKYPFAGQVGYRVQEAVYQTMGRG